MRLGIVLRRHVFPKPHKSGNSFLYYGGIVVERVEKTLQARWALHGAIWVERISFVDREDVDIAIVGIVPERTD